MESYQAMRQRHQGEFNRFPLMAAFTEEQLREGLANWGMDPDAGREEIVPIGAGVFVRRADMAAYKEMVERHGAELEAAINADKDGTGFIREMFACELRNHEYSYTGDEQETLDALGITEEDLVERPALANGLRLACFDSM